MHMHEHKCVPAQAGVHAHVLLCEIMSVRMRSCLCNCEGVSVCVYQEACVEVSALCDAEHCGILLCTCVRLWIGERCPHHTCTHLLLRMMNSHSM